MFLSYSENDIFSGVIKANISDHFRVATVLKSKENPLKVNKTKIIRHKISNKNIKTFKYLLKTTIIAKKETKVMIKILKKNKVELKLETKVKKNKVKNYKNLFDRIKESSKKLCYQNPLKKIESDIKTLWRVMKEIVGKI